MKLVEINIKKDEQAPCKKRGNTFEHFTLIELLVVVAILSTLASLLLPVIGKARKTSRIAVCLSNQKQIGICIAMYSDDNESYVPNGGDVTWDDKLGQGYDGRNLTTKQMTSQWPLEADIYKCPLDARVRGPGRFTRSYSLNQYGKSGSGEARGMSSGPDSRNVNDISKTSETILMFDYSAVRNPLGAANRQVRKPKHLASPDGDDTEFWTHKWGVTNYLMVDGSAKSLSFVQSFLGLRYPWDQTNPADTMWDSYRN